MANPTTLSWRGPTQYTDKSPFGADDLAGYLINVNDEDAVNVPMSWNADNVYSFPLAELNLGYGEHIVTLQTVAKNGKVSEPSAPLKFTLVDERVPESPLDLILV